MCIRDSSYAALFVLAKLLVSQFISGAYEDHLILAVYCAGAVSYTHLDVYKRQAVWKAELDQLG